MREDFRLNKTSGCQRSCSDAKRDQLQAARTTGALVDDLLGSHASEAPSSNSASISTSMDDLFGSHESDATRMLEPAAPHLEPSADDILREHASKVLCAKIEQLRALGKEDIWIELFQDTPRGAYEIMWESLGATIQRAAEAEARQMERLRGLNAQLPSNDDLEADATSSTTIGPDGFAES